jgi:hypothetical protein
MQCGRSSRSLLVKRGFDLPENFTSDGYFRWMFTGKPEVN